MEARGRRLSWWTGGIAAGGVLVTHWLTYRLAVPDAHHRAEVLHESGHAHWPVLSSVGLALFTVASIQVCALGWRGGRRIAGFRSIAVRLVMLQAVAWTVLEVGERAASGRLATVDDHVVLLVGLGVQAVVALVAAVVVRLTVRVLTALAARTDGPRPRPRSVSLPASPDRPRHVLSLVGAHGLRGPPLLRLPS